MQELLNTSQEYTNRINDNHSQAMEEDDGDQSAARVLDDEASADPALPNTDAQFGDNAPPNVTPGLPAANVEIRGDIAHLQQAEALPTGGFVNMFRTPYAWAKAFPTVFIPTMIDGTWEILGDMTGDRQLEERDRPAIQEWVRYLMWRSDGVPASHPILPLVLHSQIQSQQLMGQGRAFLTVESRSSDPNADITSLQAELTSSEGMTRLGSKVNFYVGNVRGTDQYWASKRNEFQATAFFHNYYEQQDGDDPDGDKTVPLRMFHTLSIAEYHVPALRRLLSRYATVVESPEVGEAILSDDAAAAPKLCNDLST